MPTSHFGGEAPKSQKSTIARNILVLFRGQSEHYVWS